ncbi:MAG TPA: CocE/NonD family hydrolase [Acidimicrobiia bacterium]|nr:CocE/NonD family hydrolase [Acidimicrobiia bacterium]
MEIEKDTYVPMRDGVCLAVDLYRPSELTAHAAIVLVTPYQKDATFQMPLGSDGRPIQSLPLPPMPPGFNPMLMSVKPLVDAGFVVAVADARGTGFSEGVYDYYNLEGGPFDGYDLVEWLADQPWCTGHIGVMGASAAAISCYITALTRPPHLEAMAANMHPGDFYFDQWRVGGVFRFENRISWSVGMHQRTAPIDPGDPDAPSYERKRAVYESRFMHYGERVASSRNAANLDWLTEMYEHDAYDGFWQDRSFIRRANEITIPTLHGGVWYDHFIRGTLTSHEAIDVPKRLLVAPGSLMTRTDLGDGGLGKLHVAWFDHFLRGADNGVLDEPPVRLYLMGKEDYIDEPAWPVPTVDTSFFLGAGPTGSAVSLNDGALVLQAAAGGDDDVPDVIAHDPSAPNRTPRDVADQRPFEAGCLTYTSASLDADLEVIGTPRLVLYASTDAADVDWCVRLCDVAPDGRSKLLNTGALKGSHVQSHEAPVALESGKVYRFDVEVWAIANLFLRGHRIRIDVSTSDFPFFESNACPSRNEVFHDATRPSALVLPVVKRQG